jgi:hypothetical protein
VQGEQHVRSIDAAATLRGAISGTADPVPPDCARSSERSKLFVRAHDAITGRIGGIDYVDCRGRWYLGGLAPGDHLIEFLWIGDERRGEWYDDKPDAESADVVTVRQGQVIRGLHARLERA